MIVVDLLHGDLMIEVVIETMEVDTEVQVALVILDK
jgi:hypothetical protein